ncbi:unnamed protein product [Polarella glacialis]|uniref:Uncharacterized protein n=1 Tax=Polarella glacialis TaxID=89957 RepID=A0A813EZM3_POLGL|nr:unnamed protein product [Polarella glacialis]
MLRPLALVALICIGSTLQNESLTSCAASGEPASQSCRVARRIASGLRVRGAAQGTLGSYKRLRIFVYDLPWKFHGGLVGAVEKHLNVHRPLSIREIGNQPTVWDWLDPRGCFRGVHFVKDGKSLSTLAVREICCDLSPQGEDTFGCFNEQSGSTWKSCGCANVVQTVTSPCSFGRSPCQEKAWHPDFSVRRHHAAEVLLLHRLLSLPADFYSDDPTASDLIIVPYLGKTDCIASWARSGRQEQCSEYGCACKSQQGELFRFLQQGPAFQDARLRRRHVFLFTSSLQKVAVPFPVDSLLVHFGPRPWSTARNHLLVPPLVDLAALQPGADQKKAQPPRNLLIFLAIGIQRQDIVFAFRYRLYESLLAASAGRRDFHVQAILERTMIQSNNMKATWSVVPGCLLPGSCRRRPANGPLLPGHT